MIAGSLMPPSEHVHWWFATGFLVLALCFAARAAVGPEVWDRRPWRRYLFPGVLFAMGLLMFPVMVFFTNSTIHMVAHGSWAETMMLAGGAQLGLAAGKLRSPLWNLTLGISLFVGGIAILVHEQNGWLYSRAAFGHHLIGWIAIVGALIPVALSLRPALDRRRAVLRGTARLDLDRPLRGPRHGADLRPPLSRGREPAPVRRLVLSGVLLVALAAPAAAFAHASIRDSKPASRQRLERAPTRVEIDFDQSVKVFPNGIRVYDSHGHVYSRGVHSESGGHAIVASVSKLPKGAYTVRWQALSGDGHVVSGVYTFGVRVAAPPPTDAYGSSGPTTTENVLRWLFFVCLALLIGGIAFRLVVLPRAVPQAFERVFYRLALAGVVGAIQIGILAFLIRAEDALQLPFGRFLYGDLTPFADGTRFGTAFVVMTLGFAVVTALVFLAWLTDRPRPFLWPALGAVARARIRAVALGPLGRRSARVEVVGARRLGAPVRPRPSGRAAS